MHIMNLDHNKSNPTNLDDDDSHINAHVTSSASTNMEAFYATNPGSLSGVQLYYPAGVCGSGYRNVPGPGFRDWVQNVRPSFSRATFVTAPVVESPPVISTLRYSDGLYFGNRVGGNNWDQADNGGVDSLASWMRVKLWCFYGGMIMHKDPGRALKYVGGESKIVNVRRNVSLNELVQKITDLCGRFNVLKYLVPEEDSLNSLVSVVSTEDLENMIDEYEGMVRNSSDGRGRLKVFLFSPTRRVSSAAVQIRGFQSDGQRYIEEVETVDGNGAAITRTESMASATFLQDSDLSETEAIDSTGHDKVEEVKGTVDGYGGSITRKESMASATSTQGSDLNEAAAINRTGHEQVDFEEVKGILDGDGVRITRKESMASATSMQDSDLIEAAAINCTGHEQVDFEEVKGILDGDGGGITRMKSMATATYMHGSDLSRPEAIDNTRHEQEDIEEVKRIVDGNGGGITRSESIASATSTQNSDFNGIKAIDSTCHGHGDNAGITSSGDVSSENNFTTSQENVQRLVCMDPNPPVHVEPASGPLGIPAVGSHPLVLSREPVAVVQPQQQQQAGIRPCAPNFQGYGDPQQEVLSCAEHVQYPSQLLVTDALVLTQHQKHDNVASVTPNQFIPVMQPMTPRSYTNTKPTVVQPVTQPHQVRPEHFQEENMNGRRLAQISGDQSYNACHAQDSQPHAFPSGHGWHQAPQIERVPSSDGFPQQVALTDNMPRFEEGCMSKKALLRTHSDTLAQGERESPTTTANFSPIYQSLQTGEKIRGQPVSTVALSAAEGIIENQVTEAPATSLINLGHEGRNPEYGEDAIFQNVDDRTSLQRKKDHIHPQASVPQCVEGGPQSSNSVFMGNTPQLYQENVFQKPVVPMQHKAKEEVSNRTAVSVASVKYTSSQVPNHLFHDPSKEQSGKLSDLVSKEVMLDTSITYDQPKQIDSGTKTSGVCPSEVLDNEQIMSLAGNSKQNDIIQPPLLGIDSAQVAKRSPPIGEFKHDASQNYSIIDCDVEALQNDENNLISPVNRVGDMQDNSNSLFSSKDPQNLEHDTHIPPPGPYEILTRNDAQSGDPFVDSRFGRSGEPATGDNGDFTSELLTEKSHLPFGKLVADYTVRPGKEEEHIKQEPQAVAEGVATSVPLGPAPQNSKVQNNDEVLHANKAKDMKLKLPERAHLGYPVSDGLGRLQIIKNSDLEELQELGSGTIGTVYYGRWRGSDVAIKRIYARWFSVKPSEQERMRDDFWNEAIKLADLHHPNVVEFYGVSLDGPGGSVATVTEYMVNGSLRTVLRKNEKNLDMQKSLLIAKEVAFGMEYLHGKNIIHFNLKSDNLLVNLLDLERPVCKVGDLVLSRVKYQTEVSEGMRGTLPWMAPELLDGRSNLVSEKVDIFSFGIVLWELLTGEEPYRDLHYEAIIGGIVNNTLRPPVPDSCDPDWRSLMERCWSAEPLERPNFTEVVNQLQTMAAKVQKVQAEQQPFSNQPQVKT